MQCRLKLRMMAEACAIQQPADHILVVVTVHDLTLYLTWQSSTDGVVCFSTTAILAYLDKLLSLTGTSWLGYNIRYDCMYDRHSTA